MQGVWGEQRRRWGSCLSRDCLTGRGCAGLGMWGGGRGPWTVECSPVNETAQAQVATEEATAAC